MTLPDPLRRPLALALLLALPGCSSGTREATPPPTTDGYVEADDGVQLYYKSVGEGEQTVVIPAGLYLEDLLAPLAKGRRLVFYDPRNRGRSEVADLSTVSLDQQVADLEAVRRGLGIERMAILGWSGLGMEAAVYAIRHPDRVERLVQVSAVPPAAALMSSAGGDRRAERIDLEAVRALEARWEAGEFDSAQGEFCRQHQALTLPGSFADTSFVSQVPNVCQYENEWPVHLWPYFGALLGSFGEYDWRPQLRDLRVPRLVIHGREDGIPIEGGHAWAAGFDNARFVELSPAGHFPFLEQEEAFFRIVDEFLDGEWPEEAVVLGADGAPAPSGAGS